MSGQLLLPIVCEANVFSPLVDQLPLELTAAAIVWPDPQPAGNYPGGGFRNGFRHAVGQVSGCPVYIKGSVAKYCEEGISAATSQGNDSWWWRLPWARWDRNTPGTASDAERRRPSGTGHL